MNQKPTYEELEQRVRKLEEEAAAHELAEAQLENSFRSSEWSLRESEERLRLVLDAGNMALWDRNLTTDKTVWNERMYELLGRDPQGPPITGETFFEYIHPDDLPRVKEHVDRTFRGGEEFVDEFRVVREDGEVLWLASRGRLFRDEEGRPVRMSGVNYDITERREMEEELRRAKEAAEAANGAKSEFLANMSHEIRTPLSAIMSVTDMAMTMDPSVRQKRCLEMIKGSSRSLLRILDDILDLSKIEAQRLDLASEELDLSEVLEVIVDMFGIQAQQKGIQLHWEMRPEVPSPLLGDPVRLRQVLVNLVGNALKFTEQGEVKIHVETMGEEKPGETLTLLCTVSDTGVGIPEDKRGILFESFTQADSSFSKKHSGTGLGLAICRRLIHMMGGEIWFESVKGKGTSFHFTARFRTSGEERASASPQAEIPLTRGLEGIRILLAEDNMIIRMALHNTLEQLGASAAAVSNGKEVLSALEKEGFDLILMDIQMPEMNGIEATRAIRESASPKIDRMIPIIGLTAYSMEGDKERFLNEGMDGYIAKPVLDEDLQETIKRVLADKKKLRQPQ